MTQVFVSCSKICPTCLGLGHSPINRNVSVFGYTKTRRICFGLGHNVTKDDPSVSEHSKTCCRCFGLGHSLIKEDPLVLRILVPVTV